jgi:hypothetical protein
MRIDEVPITLYKDGRSRPPHLRTWRDGWRHLRFMLAYAPNWVLLTPGIVLAFLGAAVMLWLLPGAQHIGAIELDINTLTVAAAVLLFGVQLALFGMLAKKYMIASGLLPESARFAKINANLTLEAGLVTGLLLFIVGVGVIARVFVGWQSIGFAELDPSQSARQTIVGAVALILAGQVGFTSLFMSILGLNFRARE